MQKGAGFFFWDLDQLKSKDTIQKTVGWSQFKHLHGSGEGGGGIALVHLIRESTVLNTGPWFAFQVS